MTHQETGVAPAAGLPAESVVAAAEEAPVGVGAGPVRAAGGVALALVDVDLQEVIIVIHKNCIECIHTTGLG